MFKKVKKNVTEQQEGSVGSAKRWRTRLAVRRGRRLHYQGWDAWRQTSWPKRHGATRTTVIQARQLGSGASHLLGGGGAGGALMR